MVLERKLAPIVIPNNPRVSIVQDTTNPFPDLYLNVFLTGTTGEQAQFAEMFVRAGCWRAETVDAADLVVFAGGDDVTPALYEMSRHSSTYNDPDRDAQDIALYNECLSKGIAMVGICRGAQFLHVMQGGKLYQDIDGHNGDHLLWDTKKKEIVGLSSSVHHQMVRGGGGMTVLGLTKDAKHTRAYIDADTFVNVEHTPQIEAFFYRDSCCLGFQGHPEYRGYPEYTQWCLDKINEEIVYNPDFNWELSGGKRYRMMGDRLKQQAKNRETLGYSPPSITKEMIASKEVN